MVTLAVGLSLPPLHGSTAGRKVVLGQGDALPSLKSHMDSANRDALWRNRSSPSHQLVAVDKSFPA